MVSSGEGSLGSGAEGAPLSRVDGPEGDREEKLVRAGCGSVGGAPAGAYGEVLGSVDTGGVSEDVSAVEYEGACVGSVYGSEASPAVGLADSDSAA